MIFFGSYKGQQMIFILIDYSLFLEGSTHLNLGSLLCVEALNKYNINTPEKFDRFIQTSCVVGILYHGNFRGGYQSDGLCPRPAVSPRIFSLVIHLNRGMGVMMLDGPHTVTSLRELRDELFNHGCLAVFFGTYDMDYLGR